MPSKQATFNRVARHLLNQGCRAKQNRRCRLLDSHGNKCAAGCLIAKKDYVSSMEYNSSVLVLDTTKVYSVSSNIITSYLAYKGHNLKLVLDLQRLHDNTHPNGWARGLKEIAKRHGLKLIPELKPAETKK